MADYVLSAKGTYDGSSFDRGVENSKSKLSGFMEQANEVGKKVRSAIGTGMVRAADAITSSVGSMGAAVGALALQGGISRALNIEQAQYKMRQMGMDVDTVMASVKESVSGTKFGLDAAATSATLLGTSGVAAGEDMTRALKSAAGVATISGDSMEDIAAIFSKVAAKGKVSGDELLQLNERGINATDALAKSLGKTQDEVRKMVSKGQIDFQTFSGAMYSTFGEAAAGANDTFSGAMANVRAALSRTGEAFATPALGALQQVFAALIPVINAANAALAPLAESFAEFVSAHLPQIIEWIGTLRDRIEGLGEGGFTNLSAKAKALAAAIGLLSLGSMGGLISQIPIVGNALGGLFGMLGKLATPVGSLVKVIATLGGAIGGVSIPVLAVVGVVGVLVAAFAAAMATSDDFRNGVLGAFDGFADLVGTAVTDITSGFESFAEAISPAIQVFQDFFTGQGPAFDGMIQRIREHVAQFGDVWNNITTAFGNLGDALAPIVNFLAPLLIEVFANLVSGLVGLVGVIGNVIAFFAQLAADALTFVPAIVEGVVDAWNQIETMTSAIFTGVGDFLAGCWEGIKSTVASAASFIASAVSAKLAEIGAWWNSAWGAIRSLADAVWNGIKSTVSGAAAAVSGAVSGMASSVRGFFTNMFSAVRSTVSSMWSNVRSAFSNGVNSAVGFVSGLPGRIIGLFANAGSWLVNSGRSIINGLVNGIKSAISGAVSAVSGAVEQVRSLFPFSPAKEGPFSGKGWVLYSGISIMDALAEGAMSQAGKTVRAFDGVAGRIRDSLDLVGDAYAYEACGMDVTYQSPTLRDGRDGSRREQGYDGLAAAIIAGITGANMGVYADGRLVGRLLTPYVDAEMSRLARLGGIS